MNKKQINMLIFIAIVIWFTIENINTSLTKNEYSQKISEYEVIKVIDGDTVSINISGEKKTLRLIGVDTPETVHPNKPVECFGIEASNYTKELLSDEIISIEYDSSQGEVDKYGRTLVYIILPDGRNFNEVLIKEGYAYEYTYDNSYKYQKEFKDAEIYAKENELGLWKEGVCE